jgi:hypothetical protein
MERFMKTIIGLSAVSLLFGIAAACAQGAGAREERALEGRPDIPLAQPDRSNPNVIDQGDRRREPEEGPYPERRLPDGEITGPEPRSSNGGG